MLPADLKASVDSARGSDRPGKYKPFFVGETCYPLTPLKDVVLGHIDYNDQLRHILDVIQKPDEHDLAFITEPSAVEYVQNVGSLTSQEMRSKFGLDASAIRAKFATIKNQGLVDVLEGMLLFNPGFRMSATECLKHSIFDSVRSK